MSKKLAIKGHSTRGKEVIELLKMMGGIADNIQGNVDEQVYYIHEDGYIHTLFNNSPNNNFCKFTLEEFLEKYPFKVGDKVNSPCKSCIKTITSMKWDDCLNTVSYKLDNKIYTTIEQLKVVNDLPYKETDDIKLNDSKCKRTREDVIFDSIIWHLRNSVNNGKQYLSGGECEKYFREVVKKNNENKMKNVLAELFEHIKTTPKEELEREFEEIKEWSNVGPTVEEFMTFCESVNKYKYPTTYIECCDVLKIPNDERYIDIDVPLDYNKVLSVFAELLICCKAYYKIAGEQMGLDKPWEPATQDIIWGITRSKDEIEKYSCNYGKTNILEFPTEEMRDTFFENFKDLIEQCKELL